MMKVLQINVLGATLSTGRTTYEMHTYFKNHEIESYIACPTNKDCEDAFPFTSMNFMHIDAVLTKITGLEAYHSRIQTAKLIKYMDSIKPDIVHLRVLHNYCIHLGMLLQYLGRNNIATVVTLHDFWYMTGKCPYFTIHTCDKWQTRCGNCPDLKSDDHKKLFDRTEKMHRDKEKWFTAIPRLAVVGVSDWTVNEASKSFFKNAKILRRIYNWIDFDIFYPRQTADLKEKLGLQDKKIILGVSTTWKLGGMKGLDAYLELAKILPKDYHIVLVGKMVSDILFPDNVTSITRTHDANELASYYSMADVYLNLSIQETFGKVSAEAVSCGTPIVAYNDTANPEIVPKGAGCLVESFNAEEIKEAIFKVTEKPKSDYIKICTDFAKENFDKNKNIKKYLSLYNELLGSK